MADSPKILAASRSEDEIRHLLETYPPATTYSYGTAGFRLDAQLLPPVMVRVGLLAALRSLQTLQAVGVMITASHNDESYNGVKISDPDGGMMAPEGELLATEMANQLYCAVHVPPESTVVVHVGRDTRNHSESLAALVVAAARAAGAQVIDHGEITTPCLHHCVRHYNSAALPSLIPVRPNESGYYELLADSYAALIATDDLSPASKPSFAEASLLVDCACGIGYLALQQLMHEIQQRGCMRRIVATNRPTSGPLNENCGSEHVQKTLQPPTWYNSPPIQKIYCAALDGDADRIVFFSQSPEFFLLDGDKIATLFCEFLQCQLTLIRDAVPDLPSLRLGVVQTAYANGASTAYLKHVLGEKSVLIAKTGVKHVHAVAHDHLDIGVYFEANGHGTILFGERFYECMDYAQSTLREENKGLDRLKILPSLVNQAVGDALSDLLLVDAILFLQRKTLQNWRNVYTDLPSRQAKVHVRDRHTIKTNENETMCLAPAGVQEEIEAITSRDCRAFIRPSGTEDVVRIYAEAPTRGQADDLAQRVCELVYRKCGGVGDIPVLSKI